MIEMDDVNLKEGVIHGCRGMKVLKGNQSFPSYYMG